MTRRHSYACTVAAAVIVLFTCTGTPSAGRDSAAGNKKEKKMAASANQLPFGLRPEQIDSTEVFYAFISGKTGAGRQEMTIKGDGSVKLLFTAVRGDEPDVLEGRVTKDVIVRLLDILEGQGILQLEDHYPPKGDFHSRRTLQITLPGQTKTVMMDEPGVMSFERMAGAVMLTAAIALPEALNHRFFPNL